MLHRLAAPLRLPLLLVLFLLAQPTFGAHVHVRLHARAGNADVTAASTSTAVVGACPAQRSLTADCVDASTLSAATGASACVFGGQDAETTTASDNQQLCANATTISATDGGVDASGLGIEAVAQLGATWTSLDLSSNSLTDFVTDTTNSTLVMLDLSSNSITDLTNVSIPTSLKHLNISLNTLSEVHLSDDYEYLEELNCSSASLTAIDVSNTYLTTLIGRHNKFYSFAKLTLASTIQTLDLAYNDLSDWSNFDSPRDLRVLNASHNTVDTLFSANLTATDITTIDFSSNKLTKMVGIAFPSGLEIIDLSNNSITLIELSETDYAALSSKAVLLSDTLPDPTCSSDKASVKSIDGIKVCVLSDNDFAVEYFGKGYAAMKGSSASMDSEDEDGNETNVLLLSVGVSALVGIWMIVLLVVHMRNQRKNSSDLHGREVTFEDSERRGTIGSLMEQMSGTELANDVRVDPELASLRVDSGDVMQVRTLAHGSFAVTYLVHFGDKMAVMKQLTVHRNVTDHDRLIAFMDEIRLCAKLDHQNITAFYGIMWASMDDLAVLVEYMPRGSLELFLKEQKPILKSSRSSFLWLEATSSTPSKLSIALQVSEALVYLHSFSPPVLHKTLKAEHVLLGSQWEAKLAGLGYQPDFTASDVHAWIAPEVLQGGDSTEQADIYSFGVVLSELDRCKRPVPRRSSRSQSLGASSLSIKKPKFRDDCPEEILKIATRCLDVDPVKRMTAMELYYALRQLQRRIDGV